MKSIATPELDRMAAVADKSQVLGEFIDWLSTHGMLIAEWYEDYALPRPSNRHTEELLAEFFEIDLKKVERERRAILVAVRSRIPASARR